MSTAIDLTSAPSRSTEFLPTRLLRNPQPESRTRQPASANEEVARMSPGYTARRRKSYPARERLRLERDADGAPGAPPEARRVDRRRAGAVEAGMRLKDDRRNQDTHLRGDRV